MKKIITSKGDGLIFYIEDEVIQREDGLYIPSKDMVIVNVDAYDIHEITEQLPPGISVGHYTYSPKNGFKVHENVMNAVVKMENAILDLKTQNNEIVAKNLELQAKIEALETVQLQKVEEAIVGGAE